MAILRRSLNGISNCTTGRLVFDADGLPLEERVDFAGLNKTGFQYKYLKSIERSIINRADVVLARTHKAVQFLSGGEAVVAPKFYVVINGRDDDVFKPAVKIGNPIRKKLGIPDSALLVVYAGSLGPQYCLEEMLAVFRILQQKHGNSYLLLLTGSQQYAASNAQLWAGLEKNVVVANVPFSEVPEYLASADAALAFRKDYFSMAGVAPIKLGEYLLTGLPVVVTPKTGDTKALLQNNNACFLLDKLDNEGFNAAADWLAGVHLNSPVAIEARKTGQALFSLKAAVASYKNALNALA
jgi:glycosyltransferase involved in cell wall biosynthesis